MTSIEPPAALENFQKPIVLVGMMGTGKSVIGRKLARALGREFLDSDQQIERETGRTIPDIFDREGETAFRDLEKRTIAGLLQTPRCVIALGGGAVIDPDTRARLAGEAVKARWKRSSRAWRASGTSGPCCGMAICGIRWNRCWRRVGRSTPRLPSISTAPARASPPSSRRS